MSHVISQGWVMYWGTSRWSSVEISEAYNNCRQFNCPTAICEQSEYHFLCREKIEISLPEVYNKLGLSAIQLKQNRMYQIHFEWFYSRRGVDDVVSTDDGIQRQQRRRKLPQFSSDVFQG